MKNFVLILCIRCWYSVSASDTLNQDLIPRIRLQCITFWRILQKMKNSSENEEFHADTLYRVLILCIRIWYIRSIKVKNFLKKHNFSEEFSKRRFFKAKNFQSEEFPKETQLFWRIFKMKNFQSEEFPKETQLFRRIFNMKNFHSEEFSITDAQYLYFNI